jgi:hypothetical protein
MLWVSIRPGRREAVERHSIICTSYAGRWGVSEQQAATLVASAKAGIGLKPQLGMDLQLTSQQLAGIKRDYDEIRTGTSTQQAQETQDFLRRLSTSEQYRDAVVSNQEDRRQLSARFENAATHLRNAEASFAQRDALTQSAQLAYTRALSLGYDFTKDTRHTAMVHRMMEGVGTNPSQAQILLDSELARFHQLSRPVTYADGTPAFTDPRTRYQEVSSDPRVADQTGAAHDAYKSRLGNVNTAL